MNLSHSLCLALLLAGVSSAQWQHSFSAHTDPSASVPQGFEYTLNWNISAPTITIRIEAPTSGWIGFGIGEDGAGAMPGADIVTCTAEGSISDKYAVQYATPKVDLSQDWVLLESGTTPGGSFCVLQRPLQTLDSSHDRDLSMQRLELGSVGILMAYGDSDEFIYHGRSQRSTAQLNLLNPETFSDKLNRLTDNDMNVTLRNTPFHVPFDTATCDAVNLGGESTCSSPTTTYYRENFNLTDYTGRSMIAVAPVINETNAAHVHHFVVTAYEDVACSETTVGPVYVWAPGTPPLVFPDNLGVTIGPGSVRCFQIETHYDNPRRVQTIVDNSGIQLFLTSTASPRPVEVGVLQVGDPTVRMEDRELLPGLSQYDFKCPKDNFALIPEVTIFSISHHMHVAGKMMGTQLSRFGMEDVTWTTDYYDFNFQTYIPTNVTMRANEIPEFSNYCIFDSQNSTEYPYSTPSGKWGLGSDDEMCITFMYYYPRVEGTAGACVLNLDSDRQLPNPSSNLAPPNLPEEGTTSVQIQQLSQPLDVTLPTPVYCFRDDQNSIQHLIYCSWDGVSYTAHWVSWYLGLESNECQTVYEGHLYFANLSSTNGGTINGDYRITCSYDDYEYGGYLESSTQIQEDDLNRKRLFGDNAVIMESSPNSDDDSTPIIVGASVGAVVLIAVIVLVVVKVMKPSKTGPPVENQATVF